MDLTETISAKSDQQGFDDFIGGATRTVTISAVTKGTPEQPVNVELVEYPGRPFRPNKTMRRVLVIGWGKESSAYIGRRLTLVGNPGVVYGGKSVGGVEIEAMSHLDKPLTVALTATRGKRKSFTIKPLPAPVQEPVRDWLAEMGAATTIDALTALYKQMVSTPGAGTEALKDAFGARGAAIKASETIEGETA